MEKTQLSRSNLSYGVDRLGKGGFLCRNCYPCDRRGTYAVLTEAGLTMQQKMWAVYADAIAEYVGRHVSDAELLVLIRVVSLPKRFTSFQT